MGISIHRKIALLRLTITLVANNFWGKDDAGVGPLLERMHAAKQTSDELKSFYNGAPLVVVLSPVILPF